ncbi:MAG: hypothetical protein ABI051_18650 [Vicinamibacterales bacterium]
MRTSPFAFVNVAAVQDQVPPNRFSAVRVADCRIALPTASLDAGDYLLTITWNFMPSMTSRCRAGRDANAAWMAFTSTAGYNGLAR